MSAGRRSILSRLARIFSGVGWDRVTLDVVSRAWTAGKLGEAAQTHLGQAGHSIPIWAALVGMYRWKKY